MRVRAGALASEPLAEAAAKKELRRSKSAVAAVIAGYLAEAGARSDVLLAPVTLLVAGVGEGGRAFDGRLRQPGLGGKRPRGLEGDDQAGPAARVALCTGLSALSVALAYDHVTTLTPLAREAASHAREAAAPRRAALFERAARVGPRALAEAAFVQPLLHVASPSQGGLLTAGDFGPALDLSVDAKLVADGEEHALVAPWCERPGEPASGAGVVAVDTRGIFAALFYQPLARGLEVEELELSVALAATPVLRGVPRVRPGTRLPAPAPTLVRREAAGAPLSVVLVLRHGRTRSRLTITRGAARTLTLERE